MRCHEIHLDKDIPTIVIPTIVYAKNIDEAVMKFSKIITRKCKELKGDDQKITLNWYTGKQVPFSFSSRYDRLLIITQVPSSPDSHIYQLSVHYILGFGSATFRSVKDEVLAWCYPPDDFRFIQKVKY